MTHLFRTFAFAVCAMFALAAPAAAQSHWRGVDRIVVIGDLEGAYEKFTDMLRQAALIDERGDWIGGEAHLVQLGDIPDRGPSSRAIMDHLMRLERQARRAGGRVHALIGNHEAMNVAGDLRYVHPGEYAAFVDANSQRRRDIYYQRTREHLTANPPPDGAPSFDDAFRIQWEAQHPLGYVEHRLAWAPNGAYGQWVAGHNTVIQINDLLFVHAGIGPDYLEPSRDTMNRAVSDALRGRAGAGPYANILNDEGGPLWYRGLALNSEAEEESHLEALLARHGVSRIIVGHTKRAATVLPRFNGRVIITDVAAPEGHADPHAFLIIEGAALTTMHRGQRVPLAASTPEETCAYLAAVAALDPEQSPLRRLAGDCSAIGAGARAVSAE